MSLPPRWRRARARFTFTVTFIFTLALGVALGALQAGCATGQQRPQLEAVHSLATANAPLTAFAALSLRYRDTYAREQPYLSADALLRERVIDTSRRAAYANAIAIEQVVRLYLQTLGQLSDAKRYALADQAKKLGNGVKAWPGSGLDDKDVAAYTMLARIVTQGLTAAQQQRAVGAMLADGGAALQTLFDAMLTLLRLYDKNNDNEQRTALGLLEVNLVFADTPQDRLLATLARLRLQELRADYAAVGSRHTLAARQLRAMAAVHAALLDQLARPADAGVLLVLADAVGAVGRSAPAADDSPD